MNLSLTILDNIEQNNGENNVSEIHFKGEGDESKTVISAKQAREVEKSLMLSMIISAGIEVFIKICYHFNIT